MNLQILPIGKPTQAEKALKNIRFVGFVPNAELPSYLAACDVLLMPYQRQVTILGRGNTADWCSPMKMFEYMATSRMLISSNLPVLNEVLNDGSNAILCEPDDVQQWVATIFRSQQDPQWRISLGNQALIDVKKYSWRERVRRVFGKNA